MEFRGSSGAAQHRTGQVRRGKRVCCHGNTQPEAPQKRIYDSRFNLCDYFSVKNKVENKF